MVTAVSQREDQLSRRAFLKTSAWIAGGAAAGLGLYAGEIARHDISIEQHAIRLERLPETFRGLRIVQLSDIHFGEYTEGFFLKSVIEQVNQLAPDVLVVTGDFVSYGPAGRRVGLHFARECAEHLRALECPQRYAVLGNHDCIVGGPAVRDLVNASGLPVLENQAVPLERDGKRLWIAGVTDPLVEGARWDLAVPKASQKEDEPVILMVHEPDYLEVAARYNVDLMLSGHTHGGQVRIPLLPPMMLPTMGKMYIEGLFRAANTQLYVNRGIGAVGLPLRFRCPPEITVLTLA